MSRRNSSKNRSITPDPKFGNIVLARLINYLMSNGNKSKAEKIAFGALEILAKKGNKEPIEIFEATLDNLKPNFEVRSRRIGGSTYQVPMEVRPSRSLSLALKWLVSSAAKRSSEKSMMLKLASEMHDASLKKGAAYKKMEETHKMAESNQAFAHFRW
jgi:small subunit ribosomal protein S7